MYRVQIFTFRIVYVLQILLCIVCFHSGQWYLPWCAHFTKFSIENSFVSTWTLECIFKLWFKSSSHLWELIPKKLVSSSTEMVRECKWELEIPQQVQIWNYLTCILLFKNHSKPRNLTEVCYIESVNFDCSTLHNIGLHTSYNHY